MPRFDAVFVGLTILDIAGRSVDSIAEGGGFIAGLSIGFDLEKSYGNRGSTVLAETDDRWLLDPCARVSTISPANGTGIDHQLSGSFSCPSLTMRMIAVSPSGS